MKAIAKTMPAVTLQTARAVCRRMPPLWPLKHFVAVNPFLGLSDQSFAESCALLDRVAEGGMLMPADFFRSEWQEGKIQIADLTESLRRSSHTLPEVWKVSAGIPTADQLIAWIDNQNGTPRPAAVSTVAELAERIGTKPWVAIVVEEISRFCAAYYDAGQSIWRMPWQGEGLYNAWRAVTELDAGPELLGLRGFREFVHDMPHETEAAIQWSLEKIGIAEEAPSDFLHRQLISIRGWAGHVQYRVREKSMAGENDDSLLDLLAIRLAYDAALRPMIGETEATGLTSRATDESDTPDRELVMHLLWHSAFEIAKQRLLVSQLGTLPGATRTTRADVQAVFCIDVRSEVFRRSFESASPGIETLGFAGFFGLPISYQRLGDSGRAAQCPVLLLPQYHVRETLRGEQPGAAEALLESKRVGKRISHSWSAFKTSAISCFSFVEAAGLTYGAKILQDAFWPSASASENTDLTPSLALGEASGIPEPDRVNLALGILRNMGLTRDFARFVLLCGHGSSTTNNPYGSGLDCGACGGHTGEANARVGAAILNDPKVRSALVEHGIQIPDDTWFLAGLHNTTTDDVTLYDLSLVPPTHAADLASLQRVLASAASSNRQKRSESLGLSESPAEKLVDSVRERSLDWAQVRPEWGLAGNAAFIVAPRERTRQIDLGGRAFLHNYDHRADTENSTLELIMTAPMVVTNWINLQYYGSTVNNPVFGSGNKVLHNVVGTFGVCLGNGGDLQTGLPLQSVHDGKKWVHEPHRLNVFIEAPRERIDRVIAKHEGVRQLVDNGWLHLFAIENEGAEFHRYLPGLQWEKMDAGTRASAIPVAA